MKWKVISSIFITLSLIIVFFQGGQSTYAASLSDGTYTVDFLIKKPDDESVSIANDYWDKPAKVIVDGGKITVQMTINHSKWVTVFKVPGGSGYVDAKLVSSDSDNDKRVVQFSVDSLDNDMLSQIHVTVPDINYDHDYTIRFVYDTSSLQLVSQPQSSSAPTATPAASATTQPSKAAETNSEVKATAKPSEAVKASSQPTASTKPASTSTSTSSQTIEQSVKPTATPSATDSAAESAPSTTPSTDSSEKENKANLAENEASKEDIEPFASDSEENESIPKPSDNEEEQVTGAENVELGTVLDGANEEDANVISASVNNKSSSSNWMIIGAVIVLVFIVGFAIIAMYRKRKVKQ